MIGSIQLPNALRVNGLYSGDVIVLSALLLYLEPKSLHKGFGYQGEQN